MKAAGPVGQIIRQWRERRNLTQKEVAERSGLHITSVGAYERGERVPRLEALARLCFVLDVEPSAFCLEVARVEAGRLAPLVDEMKKKAGQEMPERPQAGRIEELRWASDLVFESMKEVFLSQVQGLYRMRTADFEERPAQGQPARQPASAHR